MFDKYDRWEALIDRVSKFVVRDFPDVDDVDIAKSLWDFVLSTPEFTDPDNDGVPGALIKVGKRYAWQYRKEYLKLTSQYTYRASDIRRILDTQFDYEDWEVTFVPDDARSELGNDHIELAADLSLGLAKLRAFSPDYYHAVVKWYRDHDHHPKGSPERGFCREAVEALTEIMNGY